LLHHDDKGPAKLQDKKTLHEINTASVIVHNTIIEDERDMDLPFKFDNVGSPVKPARNPNGIKAFFETYN
jgi:hypothetical protein